MHSWLMSYNFICVMNLPSVMEKYDPVTNSWESGYMGEKFSQELKPGLKGVMTGNWPKNLLSNVLKQDSMSRVKLPTESPLEVNKTERELPWHKIQHAFDVITWYNKQDPISVVFVSDVGCGALAMWKWICKDIISLRKNCKQLITVLDHHNKYHTKYHEWRCSIDQLLPNTTNTLQKWPIKARTIECRIHNNWFNMICQPKA